jgi:hypothetical protein
MQIARTTFTLALVLLISANSPAVAGEQHVIEPNQLAATISDRVAQQDRDRAAVAEALARPEVREAAASMGIDFSRVISGAELLNGADLEQAASAARQVNERLAGGASSVTISTTMIIIILLVLILLIVALK